MSFGSLGSIWAEIGLNTKKLDEGLMAANLKLANADKTINSYGQKLTAASTKMMVAGGLMVGAVAGVAIESVKLSADFEKSMRNVNSISKLSEDKFKELGQSVVDMSKKFPQSAKTLAEGLYDISSSGFQGAEGLKVLEASASAASAGLTTTATSAKGITAVLNAYGYEADKAQAVSDTMFKTVDKGIITFEELSSTVGDWVGMAKAANLSFEEAAGAIAYMTTKGISASEAGVSLSRMLTGIIKPSEEMAKVIKQAGFESGEMMLKTLGLTETMKVLNDTTGGSITKLIELIPEIRGVRGANALLGAGYEELTNYMKDFNDTSGSTATALAEQSKSLSFQLDILKNNAQALGIELGQKLIPPIANVVKNLNELSPSTKDAIYNIAELSGGMIGAVGGTLMLAGAIGKVRLAVLSLNTASLATASWIAVLAMAMYQGGRVWSEYKWYMQETESKIQDVDEAIKVLRNTQRSDVGASQHDKDQLKILEELAKKYPDVAKKVMELAVAQDKAEKASPDNLVDVWAKGREEINKTADAYKKSIAYSFNYTDALAKSTTAIDANKNKTVEAIIATQQEEVVITSLMEQTGKSREECREYAKSQGLLADAMDNTEQSAEDLEKRIKILNDQLSGGSISPREYITELEKLGLTLKDVEGGFEAVVHAAFRLFNANAASKDAIKNIDEALKEYNKTLTKNGEETKASADKKEELSRAIEQGIIDLQNEYIQQGTSIERQKELQEEFIKTGLEATKLKTTSIDDFLAMAEGFGLSSTEIIRLAGDMGIKLDTITRERIIQVDMNYSRAQKGGEELAEFLDILTTKRTIEVDIAYNQSILSIPGAPKQPGKAMGGIVGYANGGIVGAIPQAALTAANGMIVPQTGRAVPIIAHEGELILNDSEMRNVAQAIWGVANGKISGGSVTNEFYISQLVVREEADIHKIADELYSMGKSALNGMGIR